MNMRLIKGFIIAIVGLFIFITILSLFIPSRIIIAKSVLIHASAEKVFSEVSNLQNWKHWQPVFSKDSANIKFDTDNSGQSKSCEWPSAGKKNKLFITAQTNNEIRLSLLRQGENEVFNTIRISPVTDSNQAQAEWNVMIKLKWYPWEKFYGIFIEKISGQGYEDALNSLKEYAEHH
jgi:hypothetical protein